MIIDLITYLLILFSYHNSLAVSFFGNNSFKIDNNFQITETNDTFGVNFVQTFRLPDGEKITLLKLFNYSAIETKYSDLCLRQITDGTHLIQLWLSNDELMDCEFTSNVKSVKRLLNDFKQSLNNRFATNQTYLSANNTDQWSQWSYLTDYKQYHDRCHRLHKKLLKQMNFKSKSSKKNELQRWKRSDLLVFPGTNWCGKGSNSKSFEDLGDHSFADRCCRDHDYCKNTIPPFSWKYHLFNYRFHYVSHCSCDERFRSCLKLANTGAANLVGKLFFNVVQTKCFLFRTEKVCSRRSWWGRCLANKRKKRAFFRNGLKY